MIVSCSLNKGIYKGRKGGGEGSVFANGLDTITMVFIEQRTVCVYRDNSTVFRITA